jgi:hypothetical protein
MQIKTWIRERKKSDTPAGFARRILASERTYRETEKNLRKMYVLEAVIRAGGNQKQASIDIGVCQHVVLRTMRSLGMASEDIHQLVALLRGNDAKA